MSSIYQLEPPTKGKLIMTTTAGDIEIELWPKEAPKACRNFVQLSLEGYYENTIFHRVVPGFIVQGGDPTGTGTGGESIYGEPFADEFHSRLRFTRRGLLAMANGGGSDDNGSQFFITLGATQELQKKHTIFGTVVGDTLFNALKIGEGEIDPETDRPEHPHKITQIRVIENPFGDIVPRITAEERRKMNERKSSTKKKSKLKATKNKSLLSFGGDDEDGDDGQMGGQASKKSFKIKSSHDLLTNDPMLSKKPKAKSTGSVENPSKVEKKSKMETNVKLNPPESINEEEGDLNDDEFDKKMRDEILTKKQGYVSGTHESKPVPSIDQEIKTLEKEIVSLEESKTTRHESKEKGETKKTSLLAEELAKYSKPASSKKRSTHVGKMNKRQKMDNEADLLNKLAAFKGKLGSLKTKGTAPSKPKKQQQQQQQEEEGKKECPLHGLLKCQTCHYGNDEDDGEMAGGDNGQDSTSWMGHALSFQAEKVKSNSDYAPKVEDYEVIDPRNKSRQIREHERERRKEKNRSRRHN